MAFLIWKIVGIKKLKPVKILVKMQRILNEIKISKINYNFSRKESMNIIITCEFITH